MSDQPAPVPVSRLVDESLGDTASLVALGLADPQSEPSPDPLAPNTGAY